MGAKRVQSSGVRLGPQKDAKPRTAWVLRLQPPFAVAVAFTASLVWLAFFERLVSPILLSRLYFPEPRELAILRSTPDIPLGTNIPAGLARLGLPLDLIVHVDCIGCRYEPPTDVVAALRAPGVINLVLAPDVYEYQEIAKTTGTKLVTGDSDLVSALHASFGPRLYRFDSKGKLYFVQGSQLPAYGEFLHEILRR